MDARSSVEWAQAFLRTCARHEDDVALEAPERNWTYGQLRARVGALSAEIAGIPEDGPLAIDIADPATALQAMLAALLAGRPFVRLDPREPLARTRAVVARAGSRVALGDDPETEVGFSRVLVVSSVLDRAGGMPLEPKPVQADQLAYLHFTSGLERPTGVLVTHGNVVAFLNSVAARWALGPHDRSLSLADPASDLGLLESLSSWTAGARVCCPAAHEALLPVDFVRGHEVSSWCLSPSRAAFLSAVGALEPGLFPALRRTTFVGEDLTVERAREWAAVAPNSTIDLLYGPVEAMVACAAYRWDSDVSPGEADGGVLPIGWPLPGVEAVVVDAEGRPLPDDEEGELVVRGPQVVRERWGASKSGRELCVPQQLAESFLRTGDRVRRRSDGLLIHLGRVDRQVRVRGYRVELSEVESALSDVAACNAVAVGWPLTARGADGVVGFVESTSVDPVALRRALRARLPRYMVPTRIVAVPTLPRSPSGAIDRQALLERIEPPPAPPRRTRPDRSALQAG